MAKRVYSLCGRGSVLTAAILTACTVNPVTGERQVALVSAADELAIGAAQYAPARQMQGGDYVLDPALTSYVAQVGNRLAAVSDRDLPYEFAVLNNSVPNAWALPGGKIAVNRGLLAELNSEAELAAVLGHEIVHAAARHGAQAMQRGLLLQGAVLITAAASNRGDYSGLAVGAASVGAQLINQRNSRAAELESDEYGMLYMSRAGYAPSAAVSLQETFLRLSAERADAGWLEGLFASHPPSAERVARNRATSATLPAGGEIGRERFVEATAALRAREPAYAAYDRGRAALADGDLAVARTAGREALQLLPEEGHFHALLGDIELREGRPSLAAEHFRAALAHNDRFFYYSLRLADALLRQDQPAAARTQFEASLALLPTADGHYGLGQSLERTGDLGGALEHYRAAAGASGETGMAAQNAVVRLDLPSHPGDYLGVTTSLDPRGLLLIDLSNPTRLAVSDIELRILSVDSAGVATTSRRVWPATLGPNAAQRLATGLGPFSGTGQIEVVLDRAAVAPQ